MQQHIVVRGARTHNLKNIDVTIPRDQFVVITGLSGSGKSSLAFDTIYAEGQRRYVESLSAYARQFLGQMDKPDVDAIDGLSPAVAIDQKTTSRNPRSTVGTVTEIYDYLRLLYARVGMPHCPTHGLLIQAQTIDQMIDRVLSYGEGTKLLVLSPIVSGKKGEHTKILEQVQKAGFVRVRINGDMTELSSNIRLAKGRLHTIEIVVDRLIVRTQETSRLAESLEVALRYGDGLAIVHRMDTGEDVLFSAKAACPTCGTSVGELEPRLFSFNSPFGACPACDGLGTETQVDLQKVCPDREKTLTEGALLPWTSTNPMGYFPQYMRAFCAHYDIPLHVPVQQLPEATWQLLLYGPKGTPPEVVFDFEYGYEKNRQTKQTTVTIEGLVPNLEKRQLLAKKMMAQADYLDHFMKESPCTVCSGSRLNPIARAVTVGGVSIDTVTRKSIRDAHHFFEQLALPEEQKAIAAPVVQEIRARMAFLCNVGLDYLTLARSASTLSGGEAQRIRLATQIGSKLSGVLYVLDEPSIGLHQRDNDRLIATLKQMRDLGNTLLVVEHDEDTMRACDYVIDVGPGAGVHGGQIVASGTPQQVMEQEQSLTGQYLSGKRKIDIPTERRTSSGQQVTLVDVTTNNLKNVTVDIPLKLFTVVTGVSGSGKSSLVKTLLGMMNPQATEGIDIRIQRMIGREQIERCIAIDQSPIGRSPRSNPATYTGMFDLIREQFAQAHTARMRGYTKGRFSFNREGGRCEACQGDGIKKIEMHFLPDVYVPCEVCGGKRYNRETLEVLWNGHSIADVLALTVERARDVFAAHPRITRIIETLLDVGLGYMQLGQSATTLSGGEAQRLKLATELQRTQGVRTSLQKTLLILDEPTTGLHAHDIAKLLKVLQKLVDHGATVVVIEHHLDMIKCADWVIDLGPEGGAGGGEIVAVGSPEDICLVSASWTGRYLARILEQTKIETCIGG